MEQEYKELSASLEKLSEKAAKLNSLKWSFARGVFFGLGSAIGAGVVAAVLFGMLNWFLHSFEYVPGLRNIENINLQKK